MIHESTATGAESWFASVLSFIHNVQTGRVAPLPISGRHAALSGTQVIAATVGVKSHVIARESHRPTRHTHPARHSPEIVRGKPVFLMEGSVGQSAATVSLARNACQALASRSAQRTALGNPCPVADQNPNGNCNGASNHQRREAFFPNPAHAQRCLEQLWEISIARLVKSTGKHSQSHSVQQRSDPNPLGHHPLQRCLAFGIKLDFLAQVEANIEPGTLFC